MYKNSKFKLISRLILIFISLGLVFYDENLAAYFIFMTILIMIIVDLFMNKIQKNKG